MEQVNAPPAPPVSSHSGVCIDGAAQSSETIAIRFPPGSGKVDFAWGPLPAAGSYQFALELAVLALAPGCVTAAGLLANADNGPGTATNLWVGRLSELPRPPSLTGCGCGAAILLSGSGGLTGDNLRYMRQFAALGYSVVAPDTMASPSAAYPRARPLVANLSKALRGRDTFWCANEVYSGGCVGSDTGGARPACFSSDATHVRYDPAGWAAFYERVYELRRRETDEVVSRFADTFGTPDRLLLVGNSEGAMVASRYTHRALSELNLTGRVLSAWSCEYNYFLSCDAHASLGAPAVPVLSFLSSTDPFFAPNASVAAGVARPDLPGAYGAWPLRGSCAWQMRQQGVPGAAIRLEQPFHDVIEEAG